MLGRVNRAVQYCCEDAKLITEMGWEQMREIGAGVMLSLGVVCDWS